MKKLRFHSLFFSLAVLIFFFGFAFFVFSTWAQTPDSSATVQKDVVSQEIASKEVRPLFDLKTQTVVTKRAGAVVEGPNGKEYHFTYRVQAKPTAENAPKYLLDPKYSVTYTTKDFQANDSITLLSTNAETETDSPIWVYDVTYVGAGTRMVEFSTVGSVDAPVFAVANNENDPGNPGNNAHCGICGHADPAQCTSACRCCCFNGSTGCNCLGCQLQNPRCYSCPVGCTCSHCICDCDGCASQNPKCHGCPVGCTCTHCRCQCELSVDHTGRCGCAKCKKHNSTCQCACHNGCP